MRNFDNNTQEIVNENYLPHNFLAEKIVLSSFLLDSQMIELAIRNLPIEAFYFKNHQEIYRAILLLYQKEEKVDGLILTTFLKKNGLLEKIGGLPLLNTLFNELPELINVNDYMELIYDKYLRRALIKLSYQTINSAYLTNIPLENTLKFLELEIFNLLTGTKNTEILASTELFHKVFLDLKQKSLKNTTSGVPTGFYDLDLITQGFQNSDLIIIAGRPSMGKTAFSLGITLNVIKSTNLPVLFFSLEMSKEQLIYRLLSQEAKINSRKLRSGSLTNQDWEQVIECIKSFSDLPLFIDDTPNLTIQDIRVKIRSIIFKRAKIGLIVIDYLQLMQNSNSNSNTENRVQELSQITRLLKNLAREFNVPIIALSQLSRNVETRVSKKPILSDLRESGSIEQDADLVLMIYRDGYYNESDKNTTEIIVAKHRNGPTGTISLNFDSEFTEFSNIDKSVNCPEPDSNW